MNYLKTLHYNYYRELLYKQTSESVLIHFISKNSNIQKSFYSSLRREQLSIDKIKLKLSSRGVQENKFSTYFQGSTYLITGSVMSLFTMFSKLSTLSYVYPLCIISHGRILNYRYVELYLAPRLKFFTLCQRPFLLQQIGQTGVLSLFQYIFNSLIRISFLCQR